MRPIVPPPGTSPAVPLALIDPRIRNVQAKLVKLGFLAEGKITGVLDAPTREAVLRFRKARKELDDKGGLNDKVRKSLNQMVSSWDENKPARRRDAGTKAQLKADQSRAERTATAAAAGIGAGDKGRVVENVEKHLEAAGFDLGKANETWGLRTTAAVKAFQRMSGLPETGEIDAKTWKALNQAHFAATGATSPPQALGERSSAVKKTEKLLRELGREVVADGLMGKNTVAAIKGFQRNHDLEPTGRVNARTLKELKEAAGGGSASTQKFIEIAKKQIGKPYVFGAEGPNQFDCSGLIHFALNQAGVKAPRLTAQGYQSLYANHKVSRANLKPGDLVFFWSPNDRGIPPGRASHIEIYLGNGRTMGTDNPTEDARVEPINWSSFIGGARVPGLNR